MERPQRYSEEELIEGLKNKNRWAYNYLYENYSAALYGIILSIVPQRENANDVLQDVFVKIWNNIQQYDASRSRLYTWMVNIARNQAVDKLRMDNTLTRRQNKEFEQAETARSTQELFVDGIGLTKLVGDLERDQREVIDLLYYKGYSQSEAAEKLNIPLGTVKSRVRLAISKLRKNFS